MTLLPPVRISWLGVSWLLGVLLLSGCATTSPDTPYELAALSPEERAEAELMERFRALELPFTGYAEGDGSTDWRVGDELLYGIEYSGGDDERITWLLGLRVESEEQGPRTVFFVDDGRVVDPNEEETSGEELQVILTTDFPFAMTVRAPEEQVLRWTSDSIVFSTTIYDPAGKAVQRQLSAVPSDYLESGLAEACTRALALSSAGMDGMEESAGGAQGGGVGGPRQGSAIDLDHLAPEERRATIESYGRALAAIISIFGVLRENEVLEPILWKVIERPSLLSVALNLGVDVNITPQFEKIDLDPRPLPGKPGEDPVHRFPIQFVVNDGVALRTSLSVVDSRSPLQVGAGLLAADGVHPREPAKRVSIRLLASRRGRISEKFLPPE